MMKISWTNWQKRVYLGIILIALGPVISKSLPNNSSSIAIVILALGALLFISGMSLKKKSEEKEK